LKIEDLYFTFTSFLLFLLIFNLQSSIFNLQSSIFNLKSITFAPMKYRFQKTIATSRFTLPVLCLLGVATWLLPCGESAWQEQLLGLGASALAVYFMAELNNRNALLRISSRMISSLTALMLAVIVPLHTFQSAHLVLLSVVLSFFFFFGTYQCPSSLYSFLAYLPLALASFVFPQVLALFPVCWLCQAYMRGLSFKCVVASLLSVLTPYWLWLGLLLCLDRYDLITATLGRLTTIEPPDYSGITTWQVGEIVYVLLFLFVGIVYFLFSSHTDKTRPRIIYQVVIVHALSVLALLACQPQHYFTILPLLVADAAIMGGRFVAYTAGRFSHIFCIVMALASLVLLFWGVKIGD